MQLLACHKKPVIHVVGVNVVASECSGLVDDEEARSRRFPNSFGRHAGPELTTGGLISHGPSTPRHREKMTTGADVDNGFCVLYDLCMRVSVLSCLAWITAVTTALSLDTPPKAAVRAVEDDYSA